MSGTLIGEGYYESCDTVLTWMALKTARNTDAGKPEHQMTPICSRIMCKVLSSTGGKVSAGEKGQAASPRRGY